MVTIPASPSVRLAKMGINMRRIRIGTTEVSLDAGDFEATLARAHAARDRPLCLCRTSGVPMYVASLSDRHILKRMPETGPQHDPGCDSYEAPYELSGFGHVAGSAIQENADDGVTVLKLDFSLSKTGAKAASDPGQGGDAGSVKTDGSKLSLRALLHYLWDQAEFNRWRPGMTGKRNWAVIRKFLDEAADGKTAKGKPLSDILFIPETFRSVHPSGENPFTLESHFIDPLTTAAAMLAVTTRLKAMSYVYIVTMRDPWIVAKQAGTVATSLSTPTTPAL